MEGKPTEEGYYKACEKLHVSRTWWHRQIHPNVKAVEWMCSSQFLPLNISEILGWKLFSPPWQHHHCW